MKKRILGVIFAMMTALSIAACGNAGSEENNTDKKEADEEKEDDDEDADDDELNDDEDIDSEVNGEVNGEDNNALVLNAPITIYEEGDVSIIVNPVEDEMFAITVVNESDVNVNLKYDYLNLNGYQIEDSGAISVESGTTLDRVVKLEQFFEATGYEDVISVEVSLSLFEYATNTLISDIGNVFIQGEAYGDELDALVTDEAMLVYSDGQINAYIDPVLTTTDSHFTMRGYTENNSEDKVWCTAENFSFNGTYYGSLGNFETAAGQRRFDQLIDEYAYSWIDLECADDIETIEFDYTVGTETVHVILANDNGTLSVVSVE